MSAGYDKSLQGLTIDERRQVEEKINRELTQLRNEMEKTRCKSCGYTGGEHQEWCPKGK